MICYCTSCVAVLYNMDAAILGVAGASLQHLGSTHRDADLLQQFEDTAISQNSAMCDKPSIRGSRGRCTSDMTTVYMSQCTYKPKRLSKHMQQPQRCSQPLPAEACGSPHHLKVATTPRAVSTHYARTSTPSLQGVLRCRDGAAGCVRGGGRGRWRRPAGAQHAVQRRSHRRVRHLLSERTTHVGNA